MVCCRGNGGVHCPVACPSCGASGSTRIGAKLRSTASRGWGLDSARLGGLNETAGRGGSAGPSLVLDRRNKYSTGPSLVLDRRNMYAMSGCVDSAYCAKATGTPEGRRGEGPEGTADPRASTLLVVTAFAAATDPPPSAATTRREAAPAAPPLSLEVNTSDETASGRASTSRRNRTSSTCAALRTAPASAKRTASADAASHASMDAPTLNLLAFGLQQPAPAADGWTLPFVV